MKPASFLNPLLFFTWTWFTFWLALWLSWQALAQVNFLYPTWYDHAGMEQNIEIYAPQNRFRHHFGQTNREERLELFAGIVHAIQHQGEGLAQLQYVVNGRPTPLLHEAEILHLQDVANLIDTLNRATFVVFIIWLPMTLLILSKRQNGFKNHQAWWFIALGFLLGAIAIMAIGAEKLFYQMHIWVFPDNHQWFFYYQDSLMSTMMKAPDLFAYIAICLAALALVFFSLGLTLFKHLRHKITNKP